MWYERRERVPYPSIRTLSPFSARRRRARSDYEMLNDTATAPARRDATRRLVTHPNFIPIPSWQLARAAEEKNRLLPRGSGNTWRLCCAGSASGWLRPARPYEAILLILFISDPLPRLPAGFSRFDNFASGGLLSALSRSAAGKRLFNDLLSSGIIFFRRTCGLNPDLNFDRA